MGSRRPASFSGGPACCRSRREICGNGCASGHGRQDEHVAQLPRAVRWLDDGPGCYDNLVQCGSVTQSVEHAHPAESGSHNRLLQARTVVSVSEILDRLDGELPLAVAAELRRLRAENTRLLRLLDLTPKGAAPPGPAQAGFFEAPPGPVHANSAPEEKVAFFGALFAARTDVYAIRYDNRRTGKAGWVPAMQGGFRTGVPHAERAYLPLTAEVLAAHLSGQMHIGLYPLLDGDRCWWLAADFDGPDAMIDALMYLKAARAVGAPVALEVSRSGVGAHAWAFFTAPVPAETARRLGTGLLREAMTLRGRMKLTSYDRLFPSQDLLPAGGSAT